MKDLVEMVTCKKCSQTKPASRATPGWCADCEKAYNTKYCYDRRHQTGWIDVAKDAGIALYERQPNETQLEWSIWQAYRDSYPGAKPSYKAVAGIVGTTYDYVRKTAQRWSFQVRMQAWIEECDRLTRAQRTQEVLAMNKDYVDLSAMLRQKLRQGIELIDPAVLKPSEISSLLKTADDLERRARTDTASREQLLAEDFVDHEDQNLKKSPTKQADLSEVLGILLQAGALGDTSQIGVRTTRTETTEVVVRDADGNEIKHTSGV